MEFDIPYGGDFLFWLHDASTVNATTGHKEVLAPTATVVYRVQTQEYVDIAGASWPEAMTYIEPGEYYGLLRDTLPWSAGQTYRLLVTADAGPDQHRVWDIAVHVLVPAKIT